MKRLLIVILAVAGLWSAYWFIGASSSRNAFEGWFQQRRTEGWVADYTNFALRGYPNRFDATWKNLAIADPATGVALDMPIFQILALSYRPNHVIAAAPHEMQIATPLAKYTLSSDKLRASLRLQPNTALELERAVLEGVNLALSGAETATLSDLNLAAQRMGDTTYRYGISATGLTLPAPLLRDIFGGAALPERMETAQLDATVTFDKAWDRTAIDTARPQPLKIDLTNLRAKWGVMEFQAKGPLEVNEVGLATGTLAVQATNWQDMLSIARQSGALPENAARLAESFLGMAAKASGNPNKLDAEITLRDGMAFMGFIPLGPVPPLNLR